MSILYFSHSIEDFSLIHTDNFEVWDQMVELRVQMRLHREQYHGGQHFSCYCYYTSVYCDKVLEIDPPYAARVLLHKSKPQKLN